ncbi:YcaO-like family protein [Rubrobacter marinus]|uniref:YcaO-like family protein n=1 Tax=Rubrobacter marinus TaxID=2653852 RepID=UPI001A9E44D6|nr:YcaO-like family protein [Rubrobacter marinus]
MVDFAYEGLDRLGIPAYSAAFWPEEGEPVNGAGYGTTTGEAAIGAFGELVEDTFCGASLARLPRVRGSYKVLVSERGEAGVLDPVAACLEAGSPYDHSRELSWVEARRYPSGEAVLVPVELVASHFGDLAPEERGRGALFTPITNGLGAGPSLAHALSHGLLELIQRDGNSVSYRAMDRGVALDLDEISDPGTRALLEGLDAAGINVVPKLAATDFGTTNLYVVGHDRDPEDAPHPIMLSACGEAAHPDRERALRKATLEFVAARSRKLFHHGPFEAIEPVVPPGYLDHFRDRPLASEEDRSLSAWLDWLSLSHGEMMEMLAEPVLSVRSRRAFSSLPHTELDGDDREGLLEFVAGNLREAGLDVLYVDLSPPDGSTRVVHAIVPGLEVETMSYGRIGPRNLRRLLERGSDLVGLGEPPEGRPEARRILLTEAAAQEFGGPAWLDYAAVERTVGRLYPLYREPGRHVAALALERGASAR